MTELTILQTLLANSPTAAAVIVSVILFLRRQRETEQNQDKLITSVLNTVNRNSEALTGLKQVITIYCEKTERMEATVRSCPARLQNEMDGKP